MAGTLEKVDQDVWDWYEAHPGELGRIRLDIDKRLDEVEWEPETTQYDPERRAIKDRMSEIRRSRVGGHSITERERAELLELNQECKRLLKLATEARREIRERNNQRITEAGQAVWARAVEQLQRIEDVQIKVLHLRAGPRLWPSLIAPVSALPEIAAIPEITGIHLNPLVRMQVDISRSVIRADYVQDQPEVTGDGVRVAVLDTGIHASDGPMR